MKQHFTTRLGLSLMVIAMLAMIGCSTSDPVGPDSQATVQTGNSNNGGATGFGESGDEGVVQIEAMITRVNLATGMINLSDRSEAIAIDENTSIYLRQAAGRESNSGSMGAGDFLLVPATISDLNNGDTVIVKADPVNLTTMMAVSVTVEGEFSDPWFEVQFTDRLASVDTTSREVTFETSEFGGTVFICAVLQDADMNWIWLQDFAAGELVDVAGRWEEDVFVIYQMIKVAE